jgi:tetratricopeptide (TPR) repeat protein
MTTRLDQLVKLHQADPKDPFCPYGIALEHAKAGELDEAIQWLDKTLAIDAAYCYAYYHKARLLIEKGDGKTARRTLQSGMQTAIRINTPEARKAHEEMAGLLETLG